MKMQCQDRHKKTLCGVIATVALFSMLFSVEAQAAKYYLSPFGADSDSGSSSASPWKTFKFAIPKLSPGDTLILSDGIYNDSNSGYPSIQCGTNAANGTAAQPITVKAANERQAFLQGTGHQHVLFILNCAYWTFEGLRVESADAVGSSSQAMPVYFFHSQHLTLRRSLVRFNNRYQNSAGISLDQTNYSLLEENELYSYHRNGITINAGNSNTVRRNYVNSRNHRDLSGGRYSGPSDMGDGGIVVYPGSHNIIENNIVENTSNAYDMQAINTSINNKYFGNIALSANYGALFVARGSSLAQMPRDTYLEHHVALNSKYYGTYFRANKNTRCKNCTVLDNQLGGFAADEPTTEGDGLPSVFYEDTLSANNKTYGFLFIEQNDFGVNTSNAYNHSINYNLPSSSNYTNEMTIDPVLGACKVWIPDTSPMKGAGIDGSDIGANVLYRYHDGELTDTPLWNVNTGAFTCGAQVAGVNDISGSSCFDVHKRLNVNTNGCLFPKGYGKDATPDTEPPLTPIKVEIVN